MPRAAKVDAKRQKSKQVEGGFGGGKPRDQWTVEDVTTFVLQLIARGGMSRAGMARQVGEFMFKSGMTQVPGPIPMTTLNDYILRARALGKEARARNVAEAIDLAIVRIQQVATAALRDKKYSATVAAESLRADFEGTRAARAVAIMGPDGGPVAIKTVLTSDEKRARIQALQETARARAAGALAIAADAAGTTD